MEEITAMTFEKATSKDFDTAYTFLFNNCVIL